MTTDIGYVSLPEFEASLSELQMEANTSDRALISDILLAVSRHIDNETHRRFYTTTTDETRYYSTRNPDRVFVDDIISVTSIKTDDFGDRTYPTTLATSDYDLMPANAAENDEPYTYIEIRPLSAKWFPTFTRGVQIVGKFGYSADPPADIKQACMLIAVSLYQSRRGMGTEGNAQVTGAGVVITPRHVPPMAQRIIANRAKNWGG